MVVEMNKSCKDTFLGISNVIYSIVMNDNDLKMKLLKIEEEAKTNDKNSIKKA